MPVQESERDNRNMLDNKESALLWLLSGLFFSLLVFIVVFSGLTSKVLIPDSEGIVKTANAVMRSVQTGDWNMLESLVAGKPLLAPETGEEASAENRIWNSYRQSLQWICEENYNVQGSQVTQSIAVTCLDISGVTDTMAQILLEPAEKAEDRNVSLLAAAEAALASNPPTLQRQLTLTFVRENRQWQVLADQELLSLLSGFTVC